MTAHACTSADCSGWHELACPCLHEAAGGLVFDADCPAGAGTGHTELIPASVAAVPVEPVACDTHDPIAVIADVRVDEQGRPAAWLWEVECYRCGLLLDLDLPSREVRA